MGIRCDLTVPCTVAQLSNKCSNCQHIISPQLLNIMPAAATALIRLKRSNIVEFAKNILWN